MKNIFRISVITLLLTALIFSMAGCNKDEETEPVGNSLFNEEESAPAAEAPSEEVKPSEETPVSDTEASEKSEETEQGNESDLVIPLISHEFTERSDGRSVLYYSKYDLLNLGDMEKEYPELSEALSERNREITANAEGDADSNEEEAKAFREDTGIEEPFYSRNRAYIKRSDSEIFSFLNSFESYYGGAHGMNGSGGYNYFTKTGKEVELTDVIADMDLLRDVLVDRLKTDYPDIDWFDDLNTALAKYENEDGYKFSWVLGNKGITFIFNPYELAAYAYGQQFVTIGYDEFPGLFTGKVKTRDGAYVECFDFYQDVNVFDSAGKVNTLSVETENDYENGSYLGEYYVTSVTLKYGDKELKDDESPIPYAYEHELFLVHTEDGKNYVYIECLSDNDWHSVISYELKEDGSIIRLTEANGGFSSYKIMLMEGGWKTALFDPDKFELTTRSDVLSTVSSTRYYRAGKNGPEPFTDYYTLIYDQTITSVIPLKAQYLGETDDLSVDAPEVYGEDREVKRLPAGTDFRLWRTDDESYMDCIVEENGKKNVYRLIQEVDEDYNHTIDGVNIEDCFEELFFAG